LLQIKTASLYIKSEGQAGFDTAIDLVASQRDVATDVVDFCQRQGFMAWDAKKLTALDTTWRGVIRLCDSNVYRQCHGRCQWLRCLRRRSNGRSFLEVAGSNPAEQHGCLSVVDFVFCQV